MHVFAEAVHENVHIYILPDEKHMTKEICVLRGKASANVSYLYIAKAGWLCRYRKTQEKDENDRNPLCLTGRYMDNPYSFCAMYWKMLFKMTSPIFPNMYVFII